MASTDRAILHVDLDAFYASVEQLDHPELRGQPVLVGGRGKRGVVTAASYEARVYGCHSAQPMAVALRACPHAVVMPGRFARYSELSGRVFDVMREVTPLVEPLSIDEAFLDVTGSLALLGDAITIATNLRARIKENVGLTASIGVAPNKFLAKLGSGLEKPDALTVLTRDDLHARIAALPIRKMWGVGPAMESRLTAAGIHTFGDLQARNPEALRAAFGSVGARFHALASGDDLRAVIPDHAAKTIGNEQTFGDNLATPDDVLPFLLAQAEHVGERLRRHELRCRTVTVKIRDGAFRTITRGTTVPDATDRTDVLWTAVRTLFLAWANESFTPVRLVGVSLSNFDASETDQLALFSDPEDERRRRLDQVADSIRDRFGHASIHRGSQPVRRKGAW